MESEILKDVEEIERKYQTQAGGGAVVGRTNQEQSQIMENDGYNQPTMSPMLPGQSYRDMTSNEQRVQDIHLQFHNNSDIIEDGPESNRRNIKFANKRTNNFKPDGEMVSLANYNLSFTNNSTNILTSEF